MAIVYVKGSLNQWVRAAASTAIDANIPLEHAKDEALSCWEIAKESIDLKKANSTELDNEKKAFISAFNRAIDGKLLPFSGDEYEDW